MSSANPMSSSPPSTTMVKAQATRMGTRGRGSSMSRLPTRRVGTDSSSRFSTKYEAKKMHSASLASSMGWPLTGPNPIHRRAPWCFCPRCGMSGRQHEDHRREQQQVAVAVEVARPAHQRQGQDVGADPHCRPSRLGLGPVLGDPGQHHVAQPVEQRGDGEEHGVGVGGVDPVGDVGGQAEAEHDGRGRAPGWRGSSTSCRPRRARTWPPR